MLRYDKKFFDRANESWQGIDSKEFIDFLLPKAEKILTKERLKDLLRENRPLRIKFGIDPTGDDIHLGHLVPIMVLRQFLRAGNQINFVIGDFTAKIGDPSGRISARQALNADKIEENQKTYTEQIGKYMPIEKIKIHHNSEWLNNFSMNELFNIMKNLNVAEVLQRKDFRKRFKLKEGVSLAEACYGILMAIDSVKLKNDIEVGGIDQLLNFQQCRRIMPLYGLPEEIALMTPILEGITGNGEKMSKSLGNYIPINAPNEEKFGRIMSIPDNLILPYFISFADVYKSELNQLKLFINKNPLEAKKQLATFIVAIGTNSIDKALIEREIFERKFSRKLLINEDFITLKMNPSQNIFELLFKSKKFQSKNELRRLFKQKAVKIIDDKKEIILSEKEIITSPIKLRVGKRNFFRIS